MRQPGLLSSDIGRPSNDNSDDSGESLPQDLPDHEDDDLGGCESEDLHIDRLRESGDERVIGCWNLRICRAALPVRQCD